MKSLIGITSVISLFAAACHADEIQTERQQAAAAMKILEAWHADQPEPGNRTLHLVCWTPSDKEFPADYQPRLTRIMQHIQEFYLREMERLGFGDRTIGLEFDDQEQLVLHTVKGQHATAHYARESGTEIRNECLPVLQQAGIDARRETILILCNLAEWDAEQLRFTHKSPYYASGSFRRGTAWQLDSPELDTTNLALTKPLIRDGEYGRISLGKHNSIFIGGIAHELGHALGLPHCKARPDEAVRGTALMGSGNRTYGDQLRGEGRGTVLTFAHALRLASHPQFSKSVKGLQQDAKASVDDIAITTEGKAIRATGVVKGSPPVYAVVAYFDPVGGGDYNSTTASAVPDSEGRFTLQTDALPAGKAGELRLFPLHANGSAAGQMSRTRFRYSYEMGADGTPDLTTMQTRRSLEPMIEALRNRNSRKAKQLADAMAPGKAADIARQLLDYQQVTLQPAEFTGNAQSVSLTDFAPELAKVGWGRPAYDRVPDQSMLLESGGQIFDTGIYAHAPSSHMYKLGGHWKSFSGQVGLASGHSGSVEFSIVADDKKVWRSSVIKPGQVVKFDVPVTGVKQLELLTDPTNDGPGADWALWLAPTLHQTSD